MIHAQVGALFAPLNMRYGRLRVDEFTAPGYFVGLLCVAMMVACYVTFNPSDGYAKPFMLWGNQKMSLGS